ncbi:enolase [Acrasis kona]|uniref:Enolase n=1 Tax=Acrasis kona TaxID=1008807 RepID=A0AAW2YZ88_9EUKA
MYIHSIDNGNYLSVKEYLLSLRSPFGTSHSTSVTRKNAFVEIHFEGTSGFGEVGLPPKKDGCYYADYNDVEMFFKHFCDKFKTEYNSSRNQANIKIHDPFKSFPSPYFDGFKNRMSLAPSAPINILLLALFKALDSYDEPSAPPYAPASKCGIEMAMFDLYGKYYKEPLYNTINIPPPNNKVSFYTSALNSDISEMENSTRLGLKYTDCIKIKLNENVDNGIQIIKRLYHVYKQSRNYNSYWSVDANASWTPSSCLDFLFRLKSELPEFLPMLYMIEQPFPVDIVMSSQISNDILQSWSHVKDVYESEGILIFADESISTSAQVPLVSKFVHGVNVKLEKAGGIRGALLAILTAREYGLETWFGCMVSSKLSCTCSAHMLSLSSIGGDLDGELLVEDSSQLLSGGMEWTSDSGRNGYVYLSEENGIGLK